MLLRLDHADRPEGGPFVAVIFVCRRSNRETPPNGQGSQTAELFLVIVPDRLSQDATTVFRDAQGIR
ncbi:hypothetical protein [Methylorubrum populi]